MESSAAIRTPVFNEGDASALLLDAENRMLSLISEGGSLERVLQVLCHTVEGHLSGSALTSVLLLDGDRLRSGAAPSLPEAYNKAIDGIVIGPGVGSCGTAAYERRIVAVADVATDPYWQAFASLALSHGLAACWSTPILGTQGQVLGTFAIYHRAPRNPTPADLRLIDRVGVIARVAIEWHAAERARTQAAQQANADKVRLEAELRETRRLLDEARAQLNQRRS